MSEVSADDNGPVTAPRPDLTVPIEPDEVPSYSVVPDPAEAGGDLRKLGVLGGVLAVVSILAVLRRRRRRG